MESNDFDNYNNFFILNIWFFYDVYNNFIFYLITTNLICY